MNDECAAKHYGEDDYLFECLTCRMCGYRPSPCDRLPRSRKLYIKQYVDLDNPEQWADAERQLELFRKFAPDTIVDVK